MEKREKTEEGKEEEEEEKKIEGEGEEERAKEEEGEEGNMRVDREICRRERGRERGKRERRGKRRRRGRKRRHRASNGQQYPMPCRAHFKFPKCVRQGRGYRCPLLALGHLFLSRSLSFSLPLTDVIILAVFSRSG